MYTVDENMNIHATRGDTVVLSIQAMFGTENYMFRPGDTVRFKVFEKKGCSCVVLQKDFVVESESDAVSVELSKDDMKIGEIISKPTDYWYEVELNPDTYPQTIIGYDENGSKVFRLYPEGGEL